MKKLILIVLVTVSLLAAVIAEGRQELSYGSGNGRGAGMGRGNGQGRVAGQNGGNYGVDNRFREDMETMLAGLEAGDLSAAETEGLLWMREEEKLARDVYAALFETWNMPIFENIAMSEQQHMDSIKFLLDRYELADPVAVDVAGSFQDQELQALYDELVARGRESLSAALSVGATIEDLDIKDLQEEIALSDNDDIRILYQNLMKGSRNHLRSFLRQLDREEVEYEASYISAEYLEKIRSLNQETAPITDPDYRL